MLPSWEEVREGIEAVESEKEDRELELASPQARLEREQSHLAFADLGAIAAQGLLATYFAAEMTGLNADPARFLSDAQLVQNHETGVATVKDEGNGMLLDATIPLRAEDGEGDVGKVDLTLEGDGDSFKPLNPLTEVDIPRSATDPVGIGESGLALSAPAAQESEGRPYGEMNVFYPEVLTDTDRLVARSPAGSRPSISCAASTARRGWSTS